MIKYKILRGIVKFLVSIYVRPTFKGTENIPKKGAFVLAGNHIHLCDPATLLTVTKRQVHFLAKASLFKMPQALIFNNMGLIGVTRDGTDGSAYKKAVEYLKNGEIVRMSKRTGKAINLSDLLDEVPTDAIRFIFNMKDANSQMDFDLSLAVEKRCCETI